jgi:hypothetical protein
MADLPSHSALNRLLLPTSSRTARRAAADASSPVPYLCRDGLDLTGRFIQLARQVAERDELDVFVLKSSPPPDRQQSASDARLFGLTSPPASCDRATDSRARRGRRSRQDRFRLRQVDASGQKGPQREFPGE